MRAHWHAWPAAWACYYRRMRTTVEFDADTSAAIEQLRREAGLGVSEAVNHLVRRGLLLSNERAVFSQRSQRLGLRIDVSNVVDAIEVVEGAQAR